MAATKQTDIPGSSINKVSM